MLLDIEARIGELLPNEKEAEKLVVNFRVVNPVPKRYRLDLGREV